MIDAQGIAAVGGLMLAMITLIGGWVYWLFRDLRNDMRANIQDLRNDMQANIQDLRNDLRANIQDLENKMDRNHQAMLTLLQGHTHADDESAVFHRLPDTDD
jgi:predicted negative regulator of RcsB-dependent stress response